ncbi:MAG: ferritin-like domain-containing protein [Gemmatimonadales bacterium]|nr:ferritin-like domain-containing protein [Gemmatimonadales bacterium]
MTNRTILDTINDPEVVQRLTTRRDMVRGGGRAAGAAALASVPVMLAMTARRAFAQGIPQIIVDTLNFALTLEYLEDEFYRTGISTAGLIPAADREIFQQISLHETAHVALLRGALGAAAVAKPTFDFTARGTFDTFRTYATFQALAQGFEDTGVRAYKGQATNLMSDDATLTIALRIHSVEARHAAEVRRLRGQKGWISGNQTDVAALAAVYAGDEITTQLGIDTAQFGNTTSASEAFDEPLSKAAVLAIAGQFIVG